MNDRDPPRYYRPTTTTHAVHIYRGVEIHAAGHRATNGDRVVTDEAVESVCSRVESFGPFEPLSPDDLPDDGDMCAVCRRVVESETRDETGTEGNAGP
jgi:hypothetical protein